MTRLAGRVALVTGAARHRGIGRGIALELAREGCDVAINDVNAEDEGRELVDEIRGLGRRSDFYLADVSDRDQVAGMIDHVERDLGPLDIGVPNAGVADWQEFAVMTREHFDKIVAVNLTGVFNVCQLVAARMVERGRGRIVVTSSVHVSMPFATMAVYGATKQAIRAVVESMAIELSPRGVNVNHIGPGWVKSFINDASPDLQDAEGEATVLAAIPVGRVAEPRDLGRCVVYLCSEDGDYVTGAYFQVDGGLVVGKY